MIMISFQSEIGIELKLLAGNSVGAVPDNIQTAPPILSYLEQLDDGRPGNLKAHDRS